MKPNILLIMTDQMRGDCMGIAGHKEVKTPYLDSLALEGHYFPNAYSACPSCIAARAELMTGLSPKNNKRVGYKDGVRWDYETTLASEMKKAGYYTKCVGKMHVHPLRNNLGFDDVLLHDGYLGYYRRPDIPHYEHQTVADDYFHWLKTELGAEADVIDTGIECNSWVARPWIYEEKYHPTNWVVSNSIDFLRKRDRDRPYFLFSSFVRPHPPFDAPSCYFNMYNGKKLTPPAVGDWEKSVSKPHKYDADVAFFDKELEQQALAGYYACITHLDHQIGRLLQAVAEDGDIGNTVIIFVSDHGELLGDHNTYRKIRPYQGSVNVPFIIKLPQSIANECGVSHNELVALRDILPTLVEIGGGDIPENIDGTSLMRVIVGREGTREYIHGEHSGGAIGNHYIVTETDKYVWYSETGEEQYFDLANDRKELHNLINDYTKRDRIDYLRSKLISELKDRPEGYSDGVFLYKGKEQKAVLD